MRKCDADDMQKLPSQTESKNLKVIRVENTNTHPKSPTICFVCNKNLSVVDKRQQMTSKEASMIMCTNCYNKWYEPFSDNESSEFTLHDDDDDDIYDNDLENKRNYDNKNYIDNYSYYIIKKGRSKSPKSDMAYDNLMNAIGESQHKQIRKGKNSLRCKNQDLRNLLKALVVEDKIEFVPKNTNNKKPSNFEDLLIFNLIRFAE